MLKNEGSDFEDIKDVVDVDGERRNNSDLHIIQCMKVPRTYESIQHIHFAIVQSPTRIQLIEVVSG